MALYSAGAVGVDIRPDTDNFWKILNAELHSRHPEVTVDVNEGRRTRQGADARP